MHDIELVITYAILLVMMRVIWLGRWNFWKSRF